MYVVDESCDKSVTSAYLMGLVNRHNSLGENDDKVESLAYVEDAISESNKFLSELGLRIEYSLIHDIGHVHLMKTEIK